MFPFDIPRWVIELGTMLVAGGAVYGGIRADLRSMHHRLGDVWEHADKAHGRIDRLLDEKR